MILIVCDVEGCSTTYEVGEDTYANPPGWLIIQEIEETVGEGIPRLHARAGVALPTPTRFPPPRRVCPGHPRLTFKAIRGYRRLPQLDDLPRHANGDVDYGAIVNQALSKDPEQ